MVLKRKLLTDEKTELRKLARENVMKSITSGGTKEQGLQNARNQLSSVTTKSGKNLLETAKERYDIGKQGTEGIYPSTGVIPKSQIPTQTGVSQENKVSNQNITPQQTDTNTVYEWKKSQGMLDKFGNDTTTGEKGVSQADIAAYNKATQTPTDDFITTPDELSPEERKVYDMLSDTEKKQFEAIGENARKAGQDYVKAQAEYLAESNQAKTRLKEDEATRKEMAGISSEVQDIQSQQYLESQRKQVQDLTQRIKYLGDMGMPGVSAVRMGQLDSQIRDAQRTLAGIERIDFLQTKSRELGEQSNVRQFQRQLENLQQDLDKKVDDVIQNALGELNRADILAKLDTPEAVEDLRIQLLNSMDEELVGITDDNIQKRQYLIDRYDQYAQRQLDYINNKNTINTEMSSVQGYYVDGNGDPIISATTGQRIDVPQDAPIEPVFNKETGQLITFGYDEAGNIVGNVDQVIEQPTFSETAVSAFASLVAQGKMSINDVPENVRNMEGFLTNLESAKVPEGSTQDWSKLSDGSLYNQRTGEIKKVDGTITSTTTQNPESIANFSIEKRGRENLQCGELVNDYILQQTGVNPTGDSRMQDTLDSKISAVMSIGVSESPVVGGIFVSNPLGNNVGHTGIVQSINPDGSIDVLEANAQGSQTGGVPVINNYTMSDIENSGMIFSNAIQYTPSQRERTEFDIAEGMTGQQKVDFLTERGLYDKYLEYKGGKRETLTSEQLIKGDDLAIKIYGKRKGAEPGNQEKVYELLRQGMSIDDIEDTIRFGGYGPEFTGMYKDVFQTITTDMSDAKKDANREALESKLKEHGPDSEEVREFIKKIARDEMLADDRKKVGGYEELKKAMQDINKDLSEYEAAGGDTNIFAGSVEGLSKRVGGVKDEELRKIANKIAKTIQSYRQRVSGAAFTESESAEYKAIFPSINNISTLNKALTESLLESNQVSLNNSYSLAMGERNYENIFNIENVKERKRQASWQNKVNEMVSKGLSEEQISEYVQKGGFELSDFILKKQPDPLGIMGEGTTRDPLGIMQ